MSMTAHDRPRVDDAPFLDIVDPAFGVDSPAVREAQARDWYARIPDGLLVLRYTEAQELLRDPRCNHNGAGYLAMNGITSGPIYDWFVPMIVNRDGAAHRRLRGLVNRAFTPRTIRNLAPFIRATAQRLADRLAAVDECEFVADFGNELPLAVMSELLGVPAADYQTFGAWTSDIGLVFSLAHGGDLAARVEAALVGLYGYVDALMTAKKAAPADDLISALVAPRSVDAEDEVSWAELRNLIVTLVFAAHDATRHQLANAMVAFAEHPQQWTLLAQRPELAQPAVEEIMRWCPSATTVYRFAAEDFDFAGQRIAAGTFLLVYVPLVQRDPLVFAEPDRFDITAARKAPSLQFGGGPHHCLGAALARAEIGEALPALTGRLGPPALAGPVSWRPAIGIHGPNQLPLRFG